MVKRKYKTEDLMMTEQLNTTLNVKTPKSKKLNELHKQVEFPKTRNRSQGNSSRKISSKKKIRNN